MTGLKAGLPAYSHLSKAFCCIRQQTSAEKGVPEREQKEWEEDREKTLDKAKGRSESEKAKIRAKEEGKLKERAAFWLIHTGICVQ